MIRNMYLYMPILKGTGRRQQWMRSLDALLVWSGHGMLTERPWCFLPAFHQPTAAKSVNGVLPAAIMRELFRDADLETNS